MGKPRHSIGDASDDVSGRTGPSIYPFPTPGEHWWEKGDTLLCASSPWYTVSAS